MFLRHLLLPVTVVALVTATPALAQYSLGRGENTNVRSRNGYGLGYADRLDNNLRHGSGGRNIGGLNDTYGRRIGQSYGNSLVTSNVTGLSGFRGDVGYRAPNEFRGDLGSNDISGFLQRSYNPQVNGNITGPANPGYGAGYQSIGGYGSAQIVDRSGSGISSGAISGQVDYPSYQLNPSAFQRRDSSTNLSRQSQWQQEEMGTLVDNRGMPIRVKVSPLQGVTYQPYYTPTQTPAADPVTAAGGFTGVTTEPQKDPLDIAVPGQLNNQVNNQFNAATPNPLESDGGNNTADPSFLTRPTGPTLWENRGARLGEQLRQNDPANRQNDPNRPGDRDESVNQSMYRLLNSQPKDGQDTYSQMLERINQATQSTDQTPGTSLEKTPVQDDSVSAKSQTQVSIDKLIKKLDYDIPAQKTFVGPLEGPRQRELKNAEQSMAKGQYFTAEDHYKLALRYDSKSPLALAGLVNAQIGSGMFISAANNLRQLLNQHPELISARYQQPLLPNDERLQRIDRLINVELKAGNVQPGLALIIAYLGHQKNDPAKVTLGLDNLEKLTPSDPLVPLLKRLWAKPATQPVGKTDG